LLVVITVVLMAIGAAKKPAPLEEPPKKLANVQTQRVTAREHLETLTLPARLEADRRAVLSSELGGRLEKWLVEEGRMVEEGKIVAHLNTDLLQARLNQAAAELTSARKAVDVSTKQLEGSQLTLEQARKYAAAAALDLETAKANFELSKKQYDRLTALRKENVASDSAVDAAENDYTRSALAVDKAQEGVAQAGVAVTAATVGVSEAEAARELAKGRVVEREAGAAALRVDLEKAVLRAPLGGCLEEHLVEAGEVIAAGTPLARIYDLSHVRAVVDVPDRYVPFLDPTNPAVKAYIARTMPEAEQDVSASIILPGMPKLMGGTYQGLEMKAGVARIAQAADPQSNTFKVELRLPNPEGVLKEGMIVSAQIGYLRYPRAIIIPMAAVQVSDVGPRVLVVEEREGTPRAFVREIEPVSIKGDQLLIGKGLSDGDRIIIAGAKGVLDGEAVNVIIADGVLNGDFKGRSSAME
jgi:RND family efflux transporter MFP subunit